MDPANILNVSAAVAVRSGRGGPWAGEVKKVDSDRRPIWVEFFAFAARERLPHAECVAHAGSSVIKREIPVSFFLPKLLLLHK